MIVFGQKRTSFICSLFKAPVKKNRGSYLVIVVYNQRKFFEIIFFGQKRTHTYTHSIHLHIYSSNPVSLARSTSKNKILRNGQSNKNNTTETEQ